MGDRERPLASIRTRRDFGLACSEGRKIVGPSFLLFIRPNELGETRLGIRVPRKMGGAVIRNRMRRLLREAFRRNQRNLPQGLDIVAVAREGLEDESRSLLEGAIREALAKGSLQR
ncbi:MAG: ribonuclease P protein component [Nitrospinota bacterium]